MTSLRLSNSTCEVRRLTSNTETNPVPFFLLCLIATVLGVVGLSQGMKLEYAEIGADVGYRDEASEVSQSTANRQIRFLGYGALGAFLLVRKNRQSSRVNLSISILAVSFIAYIFLSFVWSDAPATTIKRTVLITCVAIGGFGIGRTLNGTSLFQTLIVCSTSFLVFGILAELYYGTLFRGSGEIEYRFSGVFHPARQAFNCGILVLACSAMYATNRNRMLLVLAAVAIGFIILTKARTGTVALLVSLIYFWWSYVTLRRAVVCFVVGGILCASSFFWLGSSSDGLNLGAVAKMGREGELVDPTKLTGRLPIWEKALSDFLDRPILGHGYGAFWLPERVNEFERLNGWAFSHAHSMYIESLVNLGLVGFLLGLMVVTFTVGAASRMQLGENNVVAGRFVLAIFIFAALAGFTESAFVGDGYEVMVATICVGFVAFHSRVAVRDVRRVVTNFPSYEVGRSI
jgi:exopolysaccharide production protein ExoQ